MDIFGINIVSIKLIMENIKIRRATIKDRGRIMEISSKIWEGDDYIPYVVDEWLKNTDSEFVVAEFEGKIASFARYVRYTKELVWLEGIRTDPEFRNKGIAKNITEYFVDLAKKRN